MRTLAFLLLVVLGVAVSTAEPEFAGAGKRRNADQEARYTDRAHSGDAWGCEIGSRCEFVDPSHDRSVRKEPARSRVRSAVRLTSRWFEQDRGPLPCGLLPSALSFLRRNGQADANGARC